MKLLYITNGINGAGGLERVLSIKASYLADNFNYQVHILTLNNSYQNPFYKFSSNIKFHDIKVRGNFINYFFQYKKGIKKTIKKIKPNVISVCDDGLKGMLFPVFFGKKIPIVYERHVSKQVEMKEGQHLFLKQLKLKIKYKLMDFGGSRFNKFIVLTNGNKKEWKFKNMMVIPNPLPFETIKKSKLTNKKILVVGRQAYQKGYDRLLKIWKIVNQKHPSWVLEVYGKINKDLDLANKAKDLEISNSIYFFPPTKNIEKKYQQASIYIMPSRFEGFGMVLIEAMVFGVPCISFDCPHGPADIIKHDENGYLIENGDIKGFAKAIIKLIEDKEKRSMMGNNAIVNANRYAPEKIVPLWDTLFKSLVKNL